MKLWLISQTQVSGYDTYDSAVVAAETEQLAKETHPSSYKFWKNGSWCDGDCEPIEWNCYDAWAQSPEQVSARYLGEALPETKAGVICASFNAG